MREVAEFRMFAPRSRASAAIIAFAIGLVAVRVSAQVHEHGVAEIGVAVDGSTAQIEFTAPGSAIIGFEYEARTAADLAKRDAAFAKFRANAGAMFLLDPALRCIVKPLQVGLVQEHSHGAGGHTHTPGTPTNHTHGHADVRALVDVKCDGILKGAALRFAVKQVFPEAQSLRVQVVGDDFQTGAELKGARDSIRLGR